MDAYRRNTDLARVFLRVVTCGALGRGDTCLMIGPMNFWEGENEMLLIRDIMYCKPGKVRSMVEKFLAMAKLGEQKGMGKMRVLTDVSAERYWTVVSEMEVPSLEAFAKMNESEDMKEFEQIMKGYHDLIDSGRREIYTIEG
jgi:hypothetical protein